MSCRLGMIVYEAIASADGGEEDGDYLVFSVLDCFPFFPFFFFDESERLFLFSVEVALAASSAGGAADAAKETFFPFFFVFLDFFGEAPRDWVRAPLPFSAGVVFLLNLDLREFNSFKSAAVASLVSLATYSFRFSGVTLNSLPTSISASAVAGSVRWFISSFFRLIFISFFFSCSE